MRLVVIKESVPLPKRAAARRGHGRTTRCPHRALVALFQAISLGRALLAGGAGSTLGALAGHVAGGMSRGDLKELATGSVRLPG